MKKVKEIIGRLTAGSLRLAAFVLALVASGGAWAANAPTATVSGTSVTISNESGATGWDNASITDMSDDQGKNFTVPEIGTDLPSGTILKITSVSVAMSTSRTYMPDKLGLSGCVSAYRTISTGGFTSAAADKYTYSFADTDCLIKVGTATPIRFYQNSGAAHNGEMAFRLGANAYQFIESIVWGGKVPIIEIQAEIVSGFVNSTSANGQSDWGFESGSGSGKVYVSGYGNYMKTPGSNAKEIVLVNGPYDYAFKVTNGNSPQDNNTNKDRCTIFKKISGDGTITTESSGTPWPALKIYDASDYTGSINISSSGISLEVIFCDENESLPFTSLYAEYYNKTRVIYVSAGRNGSDAVTIAQGATWTAPGGFENAGETVVDGTLNANVTNSGTLIINGTVTGEISNTGTVVVNAGATVPSISSQRDFTRWTIDSSIPVKITMTTEEYGKGSVSVTGASGISSITVLAPDGTTEVGTITPVEGAGTLSTDVHVDTLACWHDYEFNSTYTSGGTHFYPDSVTTNGRDCRTWDYADPDLCDDTDPNKTGNKFIYTIISPGPSSAYDYPTEWSAAIRCTTPTTANTIIVAFGNSNGGSYLALVSGDAAGKVRIVSGSGNNKVADIAEMTVANPTTAQHVYVFTKTASAVTVYCDGDLIVSKPVSLSINSGFQFGTIYGGTGNNCGLSRVSSRDTAGMVDYTRLYDFAISPDMIQKLADDDPYESSTPTYSREVTGSPWWYTSEGTWLKSDDSTLVNVPDVAGIVEVSATADATMTVNLPAAPVYEKLTFDGEGDITLVKYGTSPKIATAKLVVKTDVTAPYDIADFSGARVSVDAGKKLTFDFTTYSFEGVTGPTALQVTGIASRSDDRYEIASTEAWASRLSLGYDETEYTYSVSVDPAATVTKNNTTVAYPTVSDALTAFSTDAGTLRLFVDYDQNITLSAGQTLDVGSTTYGGTVSAASGSVVGCVGGVYTSYADTTGETWTGTANDGNWQTAANWDKGFVPLSTTPVTFPAGDSTITLTAADGTEACASITLNGNLTLQYSGSKWVEFYLFGGVSGTGTLKLSHVCLNNRTNGEIDISSPVEIVAGVSDSAFLGTGTWKISGALAVNGYLKAQDTSVTVTGDTEFAASGATVETQAAITFTGDTTFNGGFSHDTYYGGAMLTFGDVTVAASTAIAGSRPNTFVGMVTLEEEASLTVTTSATTVTDATFATTVEGSYVETTAGEATTTYFIEPYKTVLFQDWNGKELQKTTTARRGDAVAYTGAEPTKPATAQFTYLFHGWSDGTTYYVASATLPAVENDVTYEASYNWLVNEYTLTVPTVANATFTVTVGGADVTAQGVAGEGNTVYTFFYGKEATVTYTADTYYEITSDNDTQNITIEANVAAAAPTVERSTVQVTVPAVDNATVSVQYTLNGTVKNDTGAGTYTIDQGTTVTVTYTADTGYFINGQASNTVVLDTVTTSTGITSQQAGSTTAAVAQDSDGGYYPTVYSALEWLAALANFGTGYVQLLGETVGENIYGDYGVGYDAAAKRYAKAAATVSGTTAGYLTVQEAINVAANEGTVNLKADNAEELTLANGKTVTIKAKQAQTIYTYTPPVAAGDYTVDAGETVEGVTTYTARDWYTWTLALGTHPNATVTGLSAEVSEGAENRTVSFTVTADATYKVTAVKVDGAPLVGNNGTYTYTVSGDATVTVETELDVVTFTVPALANATVTEVTGATPTGNENEYTATIGAAVVVTYTANDGYVFAGGATTTTVNWTAAASEDPAAPASAPVVAVAKIGNTPYETLAAALDAAVAGDTVTLLANVSATAQVVVSKAITLDGGNHTLTTTANWAINVHNVDNATVTIKDLTVTPGSATERFVSVEECANLTLNITGCDMQGCTYYAVNVRGSNTGLALNIDDTTLSGYCALNFWGDSGTVTVTDSTLVGVNNASYSPNNNEFGVIVCNEYNANQPGYVISVSNTTLRAVSNIVTQGKRNDQYILLYNPNTKGNTIRLTDCTVEHGEGDAATYAFIYEETGTSGNTTYVKNVTLAGETVALPAGYAYSAPDAEGYSEVVSAVAVVNGTGYTTLQAALDAISGATGEVTIELLADATLDLSRNGNVLGGANVTKITIDGNNNTLTFVRSETWAQVNTANNATLVLKNVALAAENSTNFAKSGYNNDLENPNHNLAFSCPVELNNVTSSTALSFFNNAALDTVTVEESANVYAIWIHTSASTVDIKDLVITTTGTAGRGIKVDDTFVSAWGGTSSPTVITIDGATFTTQRKAAVLVNTSYATTVVASGTIDIAHVPADTTNLVWVDENSAAKFDLVTVTGATKAVEPINNGYAATLSTGNIINGYYKTLAAAVTAATTESVAMLKDVTETFAVAKTITIARGGFTAANMTAGEGYTLNTTDEAYTFVDVVEVTLPIIANATITSVTVGGESVTVTAGTVTVTPGAEMVITYTAAEGYVFAGNTTTATVNWTQGEPEPATSAPSAAVAKIGTTPYATLQAALGAAQAGDTVTLLADIDFRSQFASSSARYAISKSLTIDGDNHTIQVAGRGFGVGMNATSNVNVTFKDVTIVNASYAGRCIDTRGNLASLTLDHVTLDTTGCPGGYNQPLTIGGNQATAATVTIKNGSVIQTNNEGTAYYAIITFNPVNMTITDSTIKGWACIYVKGPDGSAGSAGSVFTITDSTLVSKNVYSGLTNAFGLIMVEDDDIDVSITGTKIDIDGANNIQAILAAQLNNGLEGVNVALGDGNVVTLANNATFADNCSDTLRLQISGGTFNIPVPENCCADGCIPTEIESGVYGVKEGGYVARIGTVKYETLAEAMAAAQNGDTVVMLLNTTLAEPLNIELGTKAVTLDLGGKTLTGRTNLKNGNLTVQNGTVAGGAQQALNVYGSATPAEKYSVLTIAADVTVTADVYGVCLFGPTYNAHNGYGAVINIAGTVTTTGDSNNGAVFVSGNLGWYETDDANNVINVTGSITSATDAAIALNGLATVNISDGVAVGGNTAIAVKRGTLKVTGGTIHATGADNTESVSGNNNGAEMTGAAISITPTYSKYGPLSVAISGGTIYSDNAVALFKKEGTYQSAATVAVSGGRFNSRVPEDFCAVSCTPCDLGYGWYSVEIAGTYDVEVPGVNVVTTEAAAQDIAEAATVEDIKLPVEVAAELKTDDDVAAYQSVFKYEVTEVKEQEVTTGYTVTPVLNPEATVTLTGDTEATPVKAVSTGADMEGEAKIEIKTIPGLYYSVSVSDTVDGDYAPVGESADATMATAKTMKLDVDDIVPEEAGSTKYIKVTTTATSNQTGTQVKSTTTVGVMKTDTPKKLEIVPVPWKGVGEENATVKVSDIIKTSTLDDGAMIHVADGENGYNTWKLQGGKWVALNTTVATQPGQEAEPEAGVAADSIDVPQGGAFWVEQETPKPIVMIGEVGTPPTKKEVAAGTSGLCASPRGEEFSLSGITGVGVNDSITVLDEDGKPINLSYRDGGWKVLRFNTTTRKNEWVTPDADLLKIKAGAGFWFNNHSGSKRTINWNR